MPVQCVVNGKLQQHILIYTGDKLYAFTMELHVPSGKT